jgi:hypothetical protein
MQASDITRASIPTLDPEARYLGRDASGQVQVEIDGAVRHVAVTLEDGWRRTVDGDGLGAAILTAFTAATTARLTAWAEQPAARPHTDAAPDSIPVERPHATTETFQVLSRAFRDLEEYRLRLTELHAATATAAAPGRTVVVTVRAGHITGIELDPDWLRTAGDADIERQTGHTLSTALGDLARLPEQALESCPDLRAVLAMQQQEPER